MSTALNTLIRAMHFAAVKHREQRRKGEAADPYINHPVAVAHVLSTEGGISDVVTLCAAALHDTVEDTDATVADLQQLFGEDIAAVVAEVTDDRSLSRAERKAAQVAHAPHLSDRARLVKLADKICNLRDMLSGPPTDWSGDRLREYFDWANRVVAGLRGLNPALDAAFDATYARRVELR